MDIQRSYAEAVQSGKSAPLGATAYSDGVNFSLFSRDATRVELLLFDDANAAHPQEVIPFEGSDHRTYHYWHGFVPDLAPGQIYAYRVHGPVNPECGIRFDGAAATPSTPTSQSYAA